MKGLTAIINEDLIIYPSGPVVKSGIDFADYLYYIKDYAKEHFYIVTLTQKNEIIRHKLISIGTISASLVHPREVFRPAILDSAACIALIHNHPSGFTTPSSEDKSMTKRLVDCGNMIGIKILDHVIIGRDEKNRAKFLSFVDEGLI